RRVVTSRSESPRLPRQEKETTELQLRVFCAGLFEDLDVGVGIVPNGQESLIGTPALDPVACNNVRSAQLHVRQSAYGIGEHDAAVIKDFLKFRRGFLTTSCCKVGLTAHVNGIEPSEPGIEHRAWHRKVVWNRPFQVLDRIQRCRTSECGEPVQYGK